MRPDRVKELALALTAFPSVTGSEGETRFAPFLRGLLASWPYYRAHPDQLRLLKTLDDPIERSILVALVRPEGPAREGKALILTGHYDVVSASCYGSLEPWAFEPEALAPRLVAELEAEEARARARGERLSDSEARALADLRSGEFLPGRGLLDMKAGLAAGLALLEERAASALRGPAGNQGGGALVFLAVPDEEGASHGMLSAVRLLPVLLEEWGLEPLAAINLDAAVDQGSGEEGRALFLGSVGKLHPFALFVGRPSHAGAPFDGINPALLAAEYARRIECSPGLCPASEAGAELPPPPTILYHRELRERYDVTMPPAVFVSANLLSHARGPAEALELIGREAAAAMDSALGLLRERAEDFSRASGRPWAPPDRRPRLLGWAELEAAARAAAPAAYAAALEKARAAPETMAGLAALVGEAAALAGLEGPAAVVGLAPPYYPRAALDPAADAGLIALLARLSADFEAEGRGSLALRPFFPGISDMSFLYPGDEEEARNLASSACPLGLDPLPAAFSCPAVNIGPWGREYHQRLERVHADYAFRTLPELLRRAAAALLGAEP
ncbi:MAG TPA: M20/M25/M40 family metallo-hydrolase [Spirochaetales bacterium]|nr:M20/M25/M40 family metallo-hydrolase [Spirochaetales bacterium]HRY54122.1 M20/M25/M40 family metallo-hydrolase [Spirochaetia bacterium]